MAIPVMAQPRRPGIPSTINNDPEGYTRVVDPNELTSTHLEELGRQDNRILQQRRAQGVAAGASRGGMNSQLAANAGEAAWLQAAGGVASEDAGAYRTAASENLQSLAGQRLGTENNATSVNVANIGAGAQIETTRMRTDLDREQGGLERDFRRDTDIRNRGWNVNDRDLRDSRQDHQRAEDRGWQTSDADRDYGRLVTTAAVGRVTDWALSDPTIYRDPEAAQGAITSFVDYIRRTLGLPPIPTGP